MNILITGGASGLGEAITRKLASDTNNKVFFTYNNSSDKAKNIEADYPNTKGIKCNFLDEGEIESLLSFIDTSETDVLVNSAFAAESALKHFHKADVSKFTANFQSNVIPVIRITQRAILSFRKRKFGKIINILSSAIVGNPPKGWSEYVAQKAYLESFSKSWAVENIEYNISSNSISPSFMMTNLTSNTDERTIEQIIAANPLKKLLSTDEVADTVEFLSKCSNQINGVNLIINAGTNVI